jgi:hypothetical protein
VAANEAEGVALAGGEGTVETSPPAGVQADKIRARAIEADINPPALAVAWRAVIAHRHIILGPKIHAFSGSIEACSHVPIGRLSPWFRLLCRHMIVTEPAVSGASDDPR